MYDRFSGWKNGMGLNAADWAIHPTDTPATMQAEMDKMTAILRPASERG